MPTDDSSNRQEFSRVIHDEYERVYRFAWYLTGNVHDAKDLTQETFRIGWQKWSSFNHESSVATWLHSIAHRRGIDLARSAKSRDRIKDHLQKRFASGPPFRQGAIAGCNTVVENQHDVETALAQLGEKEQVVIILRYFQDLGVAEVASVTGEPQGTVKWRTAKALKFLRQVLD